MEQGRERGRGAPHAAAGERLQHLQAAPLPKNPKLGARGAAATRRREASRGRCLTLWRGESSDLPPRDLPTAEFREAAQLAA